MPRKKPVPGKFKTVKARVELEKRFLSSVMAMLYEGDFREKIARYGITWRSFRDKRHRAIWRAIEALDMRTLDERLEILQAEAYAAAEETDTGTDPVFGDPGSAMDKRAKEKLYEGAGDLAWLERELEAAGALAVVGGKKYLREVAETWAVSLSADGFAQMLFGRR